MLHQILEHMLLDKSNMQWFGSEDDSTPVHVAMRCLNPADQGQCGHYTYNSMHKL